MIHRIIIKSYKTDHQIWAWKTD